MLQDKLKRCLCTNAGAAHTETTSLPAELRNRRAWDPVQQPACLELEVLQGLEIRERQATVAQHMLCHRCGPGLAEEDRGAILQLNMGEGKTRVILLVLALCGRSEVVRLNFLQDLLPEAVDYLHSCLPGAPALASLLDACSGAWTAAVPLACSGCIHRCMKAGLRRGPKPYILTGSSVMV